MATRTVQSDQQYLQQYKDALSDSARRGKWIGSPDEHEDRQGQTLVTRNHEVIKQWAEQRGARPATVAGTGPSDRPGVLRFDFPGYSEGKLEEVTWEQWFLTFDERELVMLYQEHLASGNESNFFRLDSPHREGD